MATKIIVDGVLQTWGDRLLYGGVQARRGAKPMFTAAMAKRGGKPTSGGAVSGAGAVRRKLDAVVKKTPEVMVKISGSGKNIAQIKRHLDYISRNGDIPLEDQDGNEIDGREEIRDLRDAWKDGKYVIPTEEGKHRESFNIVLSMPKDTDRLSVKNAARDFAKEKFGGKYDYAFAAHNDEDHPHIHLVVKARGYDGKRLNPRKADLQEYREIFAEKLRVHGIEANATQRPARGVTKNYEKQVGLNMRKKRGVEPRYIAKRNAQPDKPLSEKARKTRAQVVKAYGEIATALASSDDIEDRKQAIDIVKLVKQMPVRDVMPVQERVKDVRIDPSKDRT